MSCGVVYRGSLDLALLWLCHRPVAAAPIQPLAWEPSYSTGATPKKQKDKQTNKKLVLVHVGNSSFCHTQDILQYSMRELGKSLLKILG